MEAAVATHHPTGRVAEIASPAAGVSVVALPRDADAIVEATAGRQGHGRGAREAPRATRVTVVICVWDAYAGASLDEAIASIRRQDVDVEILLVDNASAEPVARPDVRILRTPARLTIGAVRNVALSAVETPFLLFWDADDVMLEGSLCRLLALLEADERCVVATPVIIDGVNGERFHWPRRWPFLLARLPRVFALLGALNSLYPTSGALVRTHAAATTAFPDADGGDDWVFGVSLAFRGRVALDPQPGRLYRRHADSVSAGWRTADVLRHAALVRRRVRSDPAVPAAVRFIAPCFALVHCFILCVLRPAARRTTRRRRTRA